MKDIHLYGAPGEQFGKHFRLDVRDPAETMRALMTQVPGFREAIEKGNWHVIKGPLEGGEDLDEEGLSVGLGQYTEIHIIPAVEGAGGDGLLSVIAGAALVAVGVFTANPYLMAAGGGMMLGGIVQMTTKIPSSNYDERTGADERPSFLFDGPVNTSTQGLPVPVIFGRVKVGSVVISAGMTAEEA